MQKVNLKKEWVFFVILAGFLFLSGQPVRAADDDIYPIDGPETISLGDQGLFVSDDLIDVYFVEIEKAQPPLPEDYTSGYDLRYYAPVLEITFMNAKQKPVKPGATISSVYFNIDESEAEIWEEWGPGEISIWHYEPINKKWKICPTRYIPEKQNNGKFDRLACFIMENGIYILGKLEAEKVDNVYALDKTKTITIGKQGLFISNPPSNVKFVRVEKVTPLPARLLFHVDLAYREPALEVGFLHKANSKNPIKPGATLTSVYFNVSEPEVRMWKDGGSDEIAIWYYNEREKEWRLCPTRYIAESLNNEKYDRLACMIMGNGYYVLGKMVNDPVFPLWFKLQGLELEARNRRLQPR